MASKNPPPSIEAEAEQLVRDMAHDSVHAARIGWRIASRVGTTGLRWAERATDDLLAELEKHRPGRPR
jgi:hypothetical protein